jgi:hypothetical protein
MCEILRELSEGKAIDLGGGVFKKRLGKNDYRSIIVAKSDLYWVLEFLLRKRTPIASHRLHWTVSERWLTRTRN